MIFPRIRLFNTYLSPQTRADANGKTTPTIKPFLPKFAIAVNTNPSFANTLPSDWY